MHDLTSHAATSTAPDTRRVSNRSFATRLFQYALSGQHSDSQTNQSDVYNRFRNQLFPQGASIPSQRSLNEGERDSVSTLTSRRGSIGYRNNVASMHPSFRSKAVCELGCNFCQRDICSRGMKAILLADTSVELYSTDDVSKG